MDFGGLAAPRDKQDARLAVCRGCEHKTSTLGVDRCGKCECVLWLKVMLDLAECPAGKW